MKGIIFHLPATFSLPNFFSYHSLLVDAVTPRLTDTNTKAQNIVRFIQAPSGAARNVKERYIRHSMV